MRIRAALAVLVAVLGVCASASAQQTGGDTKRKTIAVTYPEKGRIRLVMQGTTAGPKFNATGEVRRLRGLTQVEIELDDMVPAYLLGADYTTYVLWAITPEGQTENLGEFRMNGSRSKLRATTKFQTISLLITAEPHFAVEQPSRKIVLENIPPNGPGVSVQTADIYFTGDSGRYFSNDQLPDAVSKDYAKMPPEILGAKRAVAIAELAQGDKFAKNDLDSARDTLAKAQDAWAAADRASAEVLGRRAILEAERTRELSEERFEKYQQRLEIKTRDERLVEAERGSQKLIDQIDDLTSQLKVSEAARNRAEDEAERAHEDVATLRVQNRSLQGQVDQMTDQLNQFQDRVAALEKERDAEKLVAQRDQAFRSLGEMIKPLSAPQTDARGFKIVLADGLFLPGKATLAPTASAKLNPIAAVMLAQPTVQFVIESYTDDKSGTDAGMQLSNDRAKAIADFLTSAGVASDRFTVTGYGSSSPLASNKTLKGRAQNRRVEVVFLKP